MYHPGHVHKEQTVTEGRRAYKRLLASPAINMDYCTADGVQETASISQQAVMNSGSSAVAYLARTWRWAHLPLEK